MNMPYQFVPVPQIVTVEDLFHVHPKDLSKEDYRLLMLSAHVNIMHHDGEKRVDGSDYHTHPFAVSKMMEAMGGDVLVQCVARMHDGPEHMLEKGQMDNFHTTMEEIRQYFPPVVHLGVLALTRFGKDEDVYEEQLFLANTIYPWVMPVKMADRMHYLETMIVKSIESQEQKLVRTLGSFMNLCIRSMEWVDRHGPDQILPVYRGCIRHIKEKALFEQERVDRELSLKLAFA